MLYILIKEELRMLKRYDLVVLTMHYKHLPINLRNVVNICEIILFEFKISEKLIRIFEKTRN